MILWKQKFWQLQNAPQCDFYEAIVYIYFIEREKKMTELY